MGDISLPQDIETKLDAIARETGEPLADIAASALSDWLKAREANIDVLRQALTEGIESGKPLPFDSDAFLAEMRMKYTTSL